METAKELELTYQVRFHYQQDSSLYTVIRATHKYKDSREQFEMRTHKRLIDIVNPTPKRLTL